jgi:hypothetical protein
MKIGINELEVNKYFELTKTSFIYVSSDMDFIKIKLNAFGAPKVDYISCDYVLCSTADKSCYIILNPEINDKYQLLKD